MKFNLAGLLLGAILLATSWVGWAQQYPSKPVTLVVPSGAGGTADISARGFATVAQKYLGQSIVIVNRGGAAGIIGSKFVLDAPNDGYTLLAARVSSQVLVPALQPELVSYPWDAFSVLGMLEFNPYTCVVNSKSQYKTFSDLMAAVKEQPGKLNFAITGPADATTVIPVLAFRNLGLRPDAAAKIQYKGGGDLLVAVLGGQVDFSCNSIPSFMGAIKSGRVRPLVVTTDTRLPEMADTPTATEVRMPNLKAVNGWGALYGPAGLPKDVIGKWREVLSKVRDDPQWISQLASRAAVQGIGTMSESEELKFIRSQYSEYRALVPVLGLGK